MSTCGWLLVGFAIFVLLVGFASFVLFNLAVRNFVTVLIFELNHSVFLSRAVV